MLKIWEIAFYGTFSPIIAFSALPKVIHSIFGILANLVLTVQAKY